MKPSNQIQSINLPMGSSQCSMLKLSSWLAAVTHGKSAQLAAGDADTTAVYR